MTAADKTLLIQDLQCKLASWLTDLNKSIGLGQCPEKYNAVNVQVTNLIPVLYRYKPFVSAVTNADLLTVMLTESDENEVYNVQVDYDTTTIGTYSGTGTQENIVIGLRDSINSGTETHGYTCVVSENLLYLYTYDVGAAYTDVPTLTVSETIAPDTNLTVTTTALSSTELEPILNTWNCLTLSEICCIIEKIKHLLTDCNCN